VNVTVEHLGPCKKLLRVEMDAQAVDAAFEAAASTLQREANLPGFRPGKAPRHMVLRAFAAQIEEQVKRKLIPEGYKRGLEESKLRPAGLPDVEEVQFGRGQPLQFTATVETEPDFEVPEYKGLPATLERKSVSEADVVSALDVLRGQRVSYTDVKRPVQAGDYVVVNYVGTCEGKPVTEVAPTARGFSQQKNFWLFIESTQFIPGFTDQLIGAQGGEHRTVTVTYPEQFVVGELAGKSGVYEVDILQVKEKVLPALDDAFAKSFGAEDFVRLREGVRDDLENELRLTQKRTTRDQIIKVLLGRVQCDLPESLVEQETRGVVLDIVRSNQERGVSKEAIDESKDQIYGYATQSARDRVKARLIFLRIAEKEGIAAGKQEIAGRIAQLAAQRKMTPEAMVKELQERGALEDLRDDILCAKVLDLIEANAKVQDA
jgi:trigger factor